VKESSTGVTFLKKVESGAANRSYGIEVARLAGLPPEVITRAREILTEHESSEHALSRSLAPGDSESSSVQLTMFTPLSQKIIDRLKAANLDQLTPIEALNLLHELKKNLE